MYFQKEEEFSYAGGVYDSFHPNIRQSQEIFSKITEPTQDN